jgi:hypothetical protein
LFGGLVLAPAAHAAGDQHRHRHDQRHSHSSTHSTHSLILAFPLTGNLH